MPPRRQTVPEVSVRPLPGLHQQRLPTTAPGITIISITIITVLTTGISDGSNIVLLHIVKGRKQDLRSDLLVLFFHVVKEILLYRNFTFYQGTSPFFMKTAPTVRHRSPMLPSRALIRARAVLFLSRVPSVFRHRSRTREGSSYHR